MLHTMSNPKAAQVGPPNGLPIELVPDPKVAEELGTTLMGLWRFDHDPALAKLGWKPPVKLRGRNHRVRNDLELFKQNLITGSIARRHRAAVLPANTENADQEIPLRRAASPVKRIAKGGKHDRGLGPVEEPEAAIESKTSSHCE